MSISENISQMLQWFKAANQLSLAELSEELGIPVSSLQGYLKGTSNLRADTIEHGNFCYRNGLRTYPRTGASGDHPSGGQGIWSLT